MRVNFSCKSISPLHSNELGRLEIREPRERKSISMAGRYKEIPVDEFIYEESGHSMEKGTLEKITRILGRDSFKKDLYFD